MKRKLIGLFGRARSGKGTVSNHLIRQYGFQRYGFADPLKEMLIKAGMCTREECYEKKTEMSRWLMERVGTNIIREQIDPQFFLNKAEDRIREMLLQGQSLVLDDIRLPEEVELIKGMGGLTIKLERIGFVDETADRSHKTERFIDEMPYDYIITAESGDLDGLRMSIDGILGVGQ